MVISGELNQKKNLKNLSESDKIKIGKLINKLSVKDIVDIVAIDNNISRSLIYKYCIKIKDEK